MERDILQLTIPAFAIALERVVDPQLRGRPVAIAAVHSERAQLQCVSAEARDAGLWPGMPVQRALRFCPSLLLRPPDPPLLARGSRALLELVGDYSPLAEPAAPGEIFLDLTGCRRLLGAGRDAATRLERDLAARLRLAGSVGVAGNKLVARIAAGCLERPGVCDVLRGSEADFIAPLPVAVLPGIGAARQALLLRDLNLRRVRELAVLSEAQLRLLFGPFAALLLQRARGIDFAPVRPQRRAPEVSAEGLLAQTENNDAVLLAELCRLVEECGLRLRRLGRETERLTLAVRYADGVVAERSAVLSPPRSHDLLLYAAAEKLFHQACRRRVRVRGLQLRCAALVAAGPPLDLFPDDAALEPRQQALQETLDALRERYVRIPVESGHRSDGKAATVPAGIRPAFRFESGHHSGTIRPVWSESVAAG